MGTTWRYGKSQIEKLQLLHRNTIASASRPADKYIHTNRYSRVTPLSSSHGLLSLLPVGRGQGTTTTTKTREYKMVGRGENYEMKYSRYFSSATTKLDNVIVSPVVSSIVTILPVQK